MGSDADSEMKQAPVCGPRGPGRNPRERRRRRAGVAPANFGRGGARPCARVPVDFGPAEHGEGSRGMFTANLRTKILDLRGFDLSRILTLRCGIRMSLGNFPEILSQAILEGLILVGRLGVSGQPLAVEPGLWPRRAPSTRPGPWPVGCPIHRLRVCRV